MSIATGTGDRGETSLVGRVRVSKANPRVECYGTLDELISQMGFARAICEDKEVCEEIRRLQRELFSVSSAVARPAGNGTRPSGITASMVATLNDAIHRIEKTPGILKDWSLPGELASSAALDVARTACRRAERLAVGLKDARLLEDARVLVYLNRLSDLLWLFARLVEVRKGVDASLREKGHPGRRWSRAW